MSVRSFDQVVRFAHRLVAVTELAPLSDGQLLERFVARQERAALEALIRRHGVLVWGVCRRLLGAEDAEDAFQATFLVLLRKAAALDRRASLGSWLYGVAYRVALNARKARAVAA